MYYLPTKFHCHSSYALEVLNEWGVGGGGQNLPTPRLGNKKKSPGEIGLRNGLSFLEIHNKCIEISI